MRLFILVFTTSILIFPNSGYSQDNDALNDSLKNMFITAESYMVDENFIAAIPYYKEIIAHYPENGNINFKLGLCYLKTTLEKAKAIPYFEKAIPAVDEECDPAEFEAACAPLEIFYFLGKAYQKNYKFQEAIDQYKKFSTYIDPENTVLFSQVNKSIDECNNGLELMMAPVDIDVTNLGETVNSPYDDHSPVISADESVLIFTSKREGTTGGTESEDGQYYEDIYISYSDARGNWSEPVSIGENINTPNHEATIGLSVDGQELFIYRDDRNDGNIYSSQLEGDQWSVPDKMGHGVNSKYKENHASLASDGNSFYFSSQRKGGLGGSDIYIIRKLPNGKWGYPQNLGPTINTPYDEEGPFIHPDNVTLFFSSKGHKTIGGYDIFFSTLKTDGSWTEPENIGYPINTTDDDVFYVLTPDGRRAYYSSFKSEGYGRNDIYKISLPESFQRNLTVLTGVVALEEGGHPEYSEITLTDLQTSEIAGYYIPNTKSGKYIYILLPGKYQVECTADDYPPYEGIIDVPEKSSYLETGKAVKLDTIWFGREIAMVTDTTENPPPSDTVSVPDTGEIKQQKDSLLTQTDTEKQQNQNDSTDKQLTSHSNKQQDTVKKTDTISKDIVVRDAVKKIEDITANDSLDQKTVVEKIEKADTSETISTTSEESPVEVANILFGFDKHQTYDYNINLDKLASYLVKHPNTIIEIGGYADPQGPASYNITLTKKRADFVKNYLVDKNVKESSLKTKGYGECCQISLNTNPTTRKYNRRVEFKIIQGGKGLAIKPIKVPQAYKLN